MNTITGQPINNAVAADEAVVVYNLAGIDQSAPSIQSYESRYNLTPEDKQNLQIGFPPRLFNDPIRTIQRTDIDQAITFFKQLDGVINNATDLALQASATVATLVTLARQRHLLNNSHNRLGRLVAEAPSYDFIVQYDAAIFQIGNDVLNLLAVDPVSLDRPSVTTIRSLEDSAPVAMRSKVRHILANYGYQCNHEEKAIAVVMQQAELLAAATHGGFP
jgi:hypothetical protein